MISKSFKKQLIVNIYNTQLLSNNDKIRKISINSIERIKIWLLFKRDESITLEYKYKDYNIEHRIRWFLYYLTDLIYEFYKYNRNNKNSDILSLSYILFKIKYTLERKQDIDEDKDYVKYLENIYD